MECSEPKIPKSLGVSRQYRGLGVKGLGVQGFREPSLSHITPRPLKHESVHGLSVGGLRFTLSEVLGIQCPALASNLKPKNLKPYILDPNPIIFNRPNMPKSSSNIHEARAGLGGPRRRSRGGALLTEFHVHGN